MVDVYVISCDELFLLWGLEPIWFVCFCIQNGSRRVLKEFSFLHAYSSSPQTWPSHFNCYCKGFKILKVFLPSSKTGALVQSDFEFKMSSHFCCCQKCSNHF